MTRNIEDFIHFEGLMIYVSVASFHVVLCVLTILYCSFQIRQLHKAVQARTWSLLGLLLLLLIVAILVARTDQTAVQLTYRNTCELLKQAEVAVHIMPPDCRSGAPSLLAWLAILPFVSGIVAAVFATAVASLAAEPLPETPESAWRSAFASRARTLQRVFYVVSLVLVTSTISIMLFLQLPLALAADYPTKLAVTGHAQGMTVFWGTVFTLTLVMMFAPSAFLLLKTARQYEKRSETSGGGSRLVERADLYLAPETARQRRDPAGAIAGRPGRRAPGEARQLGLGPTASGTTGSQPSFAQRGNRIAQPQPGSSESRVRAAALNH